MSSRSTLFTDIEQMPWLAVTGRVADWLRQPEGRLPVSCTVRVPQNLWANVLDSLVFTSRALRYAAGVALNLEQVEARSLVNPSSRSIRVTWDPDERARPDETLLVVADSMDTDPAVPGWGIERSWQLAGMLGQDQNIWVDLSRLRPAGTVNSRGLVASGPETFAQIYENLGRYLQSPSLSHLLRLFSCLNGVLRRGGAYKNGAITVHLNWDHPEVGEYLAQDPAETPWIKRCLTVTPEVLSSPHLDQILARVADGSLWLGKPVYDGQGRRLYLNVCLEVLLPDRGTCLLGHLNLGRLTVGQIPDAYPKAMSWLCRLHSLTGVEQSGIYLPPQEDRQVGLGLLGLASHLAISGIRYVDLVEALEAVLEGQELEFLNPRAVDLALALWRGIHAAAEVARRYRMERAFTVAPTASSAYRYTDAEGWITTPEISPPLSDQVERESETFGIQFFDHHPRVEVAGRDVDWSTYYRLCCAIQRLYDETGLGHAISMNLWSPGARCDRDWLEDWLHSPLRSTYYRLPVAQNLAKDQILCATDLCSACAE